MEVCHSLLSFAIRMSANRLMVSLATSSLPSVKALPRMYFSAPFSQSALNSLSRLTFSVMISAAPAMVPRANAWSSERPRSLASMVVSAAAPVPMMASATAWFPPDTAVLKRKSAMLMPVL